MVKLKPKFFKQLLGKKRYLNKRNISKPKNTLFVEIKRKNKIFKCREN